MGTHSKDWMKRVAAWLAVLLFSGAVTALAAHHEEGKTTSADVKQEVSETWEVLKEYTVEQRNEAMVAAEKKLAELDARMDKMQDAIDERWQKMSKTARKNMRKSLDLLRRERNEAAEWYGAMRKGSAEAWEEIKKGFAESYDRLEKAYEKAKKDFEKGK